MESPIEFHFKEVEFEFLFQDEIRNWIQQIASRYHYKVNHLSVVFCSDEELLQMNIEHLNHDFYTDILTFPFEIKGKEIFGDLFISVDRVKENAENLDISFIDELHRVIIHGVLHLIGFDDKTPAAKSKMTKEENLALSLRMF